MNRQPIIDGQSIDQFIPKHLRDMFYQHPMPQYKYAIHDGYAPYSFPTDGLVMYLPLWALKGDSINSVDAYKHTGAVTNALWRPDGRYFGGAAHITIPAQTWGIANAWSIYIWVKPDDTTTHMRALCTGDGASNSAIRVVLNQNAGTELRIIVYDDGGVDYKDYRKNIISTDWQLLTLTWDGTNLLVYRNASLQTMTKTLDPAITMTDRSRDLVLGKQSVTFYKGNESEVWYYDNAHAQGIVTHICNATKWRYP